MRKAGPRGCGYQGIPWEGSGGKATVAVGLGGDSGFICISQAMHTGRCTRGQAHAWSVL